MSNLLDKLHNDHKNFSKLLKYTELQLGRVKDCEVVDFETLLIALEYMKDYSDAIHHPLENVLFGYFLEHYDLDREEIDHLMNEHEGMPQLTDKIIEMLECVISEMPVERRLFCERLAEYIDVKKKHMNHEESAIYPSLYKNMKEEDWQALNDTLSNTTDPLFDQPIKKNYQLLLARITAAI